MHPGKPIVQLLLTFFLLTSVQHSLVAQEINEKIFSRYKKEDGLSHNVVTGITQDSIGYIWMSTTAGINRYNGSSFVQFHSNANSNSLPSELVMGLVWLDSHRLAAYAGGLHIIDTRTGETRNLFIPYRNNLYAYKFNTVLQACGNEAGDIFLVTRSGFYHFDKNYTLVFRYDYYTDKEVPNTSFGFGRQILRLNNNELAIVSTFGVYHYNISRKEFRPIEVKDCPLAPELATYANTFDEFYQANPNFFVIIKTFSDSVIYVNTSLNQRTLSHLPFEKAITHFDYRSKLVQISDTLLYITGNISGFFKIRLDPTTGKLDVSPKKYFPSYYCRDLHKDRNHDLWIATNKGILAQDNNKLYVEQALLPSSFEERFPNLVIDDMISLGDKIYVATRGYAGMLIFDKKSLQFIRRVGLENYRRFPNNIYSIVKANDSAIWLGSNGPLFRVDLKTDKITEVSLPRWDSVYEWIADLYRDRKKNIWIATSNLYKYDATSRSVTLIPDGGDPYDKIQRPNTLGEDAAGNIWVAGHGIVRYNTTTNQFDRFLDSFPFIKIPDRQVTCFVADKQNNLWINSNNNGLICYNIDKQTFIHFTRENGLPDNNISSMIIIGNKLWIATYSGIACLDLQTQRITGFGKEDGFPDLPIFSGSRIYYDSTDKKLYVGFANTLVRFDPLIIYQRPPVPHLFVENLVTGDQTRFLFPASHVTTSWRNNEITVTIGTINFFTGNSQRFAYRLVKEDSTHWQDLGTQNSFSITNLPPGNHRIQVKLRSLNNRWPDQVKEIRLNILPPFWQKSWFRALMVMLMILGFYLFLKWRIGLIRRKERAKTNIQKMKAEEYKHQFELEQISNYFSYSLSDKRTVDEVLWDVSRNLIGRMHYVDCMIYLWNSDKTRMIQKAGLGSKGNPGAIKRKFFDVEPGQGVVGHVMITKEALIVPDTRKDSRYRVDDVVRLSEICVPILHNSELMGIIDSEHHTENHFRERDIKILTTIATLMGNKISQIESEQSLEIKQKEIAFINQQLAEAQLSALQTQMNPHFIFNSLNSIKGMILENEQQKASRYLSKFAQMIRVTVNQSKELFTTIYENIEHLENYLIMEKLRFDDSFSYSITFDDHIDKEDTLIPTLMIQPLAENAIWHGLMQKKGEKNLTIHFSQVNGRITCCVEDNGIGIKKAQQIKLQNKTGYQSVGLSNLRNRIKIMNEKYGTKCTLDICDLMEFDENKTGTCATLEFTIINNKPRL